MDQINSHTGVDIRGEECVSIQINDILDELREQNKLLINELTFVNNYNNILEKFKHYLDFNLEKCHCFESNGKELDLIYNEYKVFINNEKHENIPEINRNNKDLNLKPNKARKSFSDQNNNFDKTVNTLVVFEPNNKKEVKYPWNPRHGCVWIGCDFKTDKKKILIDHMNIHNEVRPYLCADVKCGKTFFSDKSLKAHEKRHMNAKRYNNSIINEDLDESNQLLNKKLKNQSINKIIGDKTEDSFDQIINESKTCDNHVFDNNCDNNSQIDSVLMKPKRNLRHKCSWVGCDFKTEKRLILKDHMNIHKNIRPYVCLEPNCGKRYFSSKSLGSHRKRHLNTGSYKCSYSDCNFNGRTLNIVMSHIKLVHSIDKLYYCSSCKVYNETEFSFKRHLVSHLETNFKCDYPDCEYRSNQLSKFNVHLRKHTGEKPFRCDWPGCEKIFSRLDGLKDHQIRHSDLRPYHCSWPGCESKFKRANDLKMHSNYHTNERLLKCDWPGCDFRTLTNKVLKEHEMKHNGDSYDCTWNSCDKKFKLKDDLETHLYLHQNPLKCDWPGCDRTYTLKSSFKYHMHAHRRQLK